MQKVINGIQQIGIGVTNAKEVFNWYRTHLGFDVLVFKDESEANLMTRYTNNQVFKRLALLSLNLRGGGGLEIWQFKDRTPEPPKQTILLGDLGINVMKIKTVKVAKTHVSFQKINLPFLIDIYKFNHKNSHFFCSDPYNNLLQIVKSEEEFAITKTPIGGVIGTIIGVSNMDDTILFYKQLLGYDVLFSDRIGIFKDFENLLGGKNKFRRVVLKHSKRLVGGFGELLGTSEIELIQVLDRIPVKIYKNRMWGDIGYIHLCFDIYGMSAFKNKAKKLNYLFTVDSTDSFDMGDAAGQFGYVEDPDGTLIELVETHKVPIYKKWGLFIDLKKRNPLKPLPKWLIKKMKIHRIKNDL